MITFEESLGKLINLLPAVTIGDNDYSIKYNWGTQEVLNKYLITNKENSYPLIWLIVGRDTNEIKGKNISRNARIVIATRSMNKEEFNEFQFQTYYKEILHPIQLNLIKVLERSGISQIIDDTYNSEFIPNYSFQDEAGTLVDIWNAIVLNIDISFNTDYQCRIKQVKFVVQSTDNGGVDNGGGSFVCSGGNKYIDISQVFVNPFTPNLETNIRLLPSSEIVDLWLDNENYGNGLGGARIFICLNSFEIGSNVYSGSSNELIGSFFDGYWLANQTGFSGTGSQNGVNINYRYNPIRSTPYSINNPITNQPLPFAFSQDTVEPVIIKIVNSIITEVIPLPITGFAYEG